MPRPLFLCNIHLIFSLSTSILSLSNSLNSFSSIWGLAWYKSYLWKKYFIWIYKAVYIFKGRIKTYVSDLFTINSSFILQYLFDAWVLHSGFKIVSPNSGNHSLLRLTKFTPENQYVCLKISFHNILLGFKLNSNCSFLLKQTYFLFKTFSNSLCATKIKQFYFIFSQICKS